MAQGNLTQLKTDRERWAQGKLTQFETDRYGTGQTDREMDTWQTDTTVN